MDKLEAFRNIASQASRGELAFPTNIALTLKIKQALDNPDGHLADSAKLILAEPLLSARTVAMANSAAYNRSGNEITNVTTAVMRLGSRTLSALAAAVIIRQLGGKSANPELRAKADQLWDHTAHVAALAHVIARHTKGIDPEAAMFAGIVHEVGGFYLLSRADEYPGLLDGDPEDWMEYGEKITGRCVLKELAVPDSVMEAVEIMWQGVGALPPKSLGDVLLLANQLTPISSPLQRQKDPTSGEDSMVDFNIGDDTLGYILQESEDEVAALMAVLLN